jgi:GNAT superfamily N-acetyltransferase
VPTQPQSFYRDEVAVWEKTIGVWETAQGEIAGVVHSENEEPGEVWFQLHPDHTDLCPEMLDYAERVLADRGDGWCFAKLYLPNSSPMEELARQRGYQILGEPLRYLALSLTEFEIPDTAFPPGFVLKSVAEEDDVDRRRMAKSMAFGEGLAPSDWAPAWTFRELQAAPDYRADLDWVVVAPNGDYAAFATIWVDCKNRYAIFEPVGTVRAYQGLGLGRTLLYAGYRRMVELGMTRTFMASGNDFYRKAGFQPTDTTIAAWVRRWRE